MQDPDKVNQFKHRMNTLAYEEAMMAAARDYGEVRHNTNCRNVTLLRAQPAHQAGSSQATELTGAHWSCYASHALGARGLAIIILVAGSVSNRPVKRAQVQHVQKATPHMQELLQKERKENAAAQHSKVDMDDLLEDPELERLHEQRLEKMKSEREKRQIMSHKGHGEVTDITEGEFLEVVTKTELVVCHFYHKDFERCKIMDKHLKLLAPRFFSTRFCRISAPDTPFFVAKLSIQVLPCVLLFVNGVAVDRVVGFDELGAKDDFATETLEARMKACGVIKAQKVQESAEPDQQRHAVRKGVAARGMIEAGDDDEDSDFD